MSLERELVFELKNEKKSEQEILDTIEGMRELGVKMNSDIVKVALSQYDAKNLLKKRKEYKRTSKDKINGLIEEERKEIKDNYPNLLSMRIIKEDSMVGLNYFKCNNCKKYNVTKVSSEIKYLNDKGEIPVPQIEKKFLLNYCRRCGYIDGEE